MSILIKGLDMPETCAECPCMRHDSMGNGFRTLHAYQCNLTLNRIENPDFVLSRKEANCPLVEVPTPHGRLIDADEIRWVEHHDSDGNVSRYMVAFSDEMPPTVIEQEGEG